ncbi:MAG: hypothetical protein JSS49_26120 [Planctomycetes bacterium]|nr:hypothetical protein [Planctomycetota bacterium]
MSRLSVYWPDECDMAAASAADRPMILPFPGSRRGESPARLDVITRARILFENRRCTHCGYPVVKPLEQDDALVNSTGLEIPGTATLIGFECRGCSSTWSI